uniref:Uncharacterized protein n=1 Tax=Arundo donax TaxID=35708 RepID=A0A0A9HN25_ARUDO
MSVVGRPLRTSFATIGRCGKV